MRTFATLRTQNVNLIDLNGCHFMRMSRKSLFRYGKEHASKLK